MKSFTFFRGIEIDVFKWLCDTNISELIERRILCITFDKIRCYSSEGITSLSNIKIIFIKIIGNLTIFHFLPIRKSKSFMFTTYRNIIEIREVYISHSIKL